jgi:hypothetical protein
MNAMLLKMVLNTYNLKSCHLNLTLKSFITLEGHAHNSSKQTAILTLGRNLHIYDVISKIMSSTYLKVDCTVNL